MSFAVSFDIDGVISDYPRHYLEFIFQKSGESLANIDEAKQVLGQIKYNEIKTEYRNSKEKYSIPIRSELLDLSDTIYKMGGMVFINSRRPFNEFPQMLTKTIEWLSKSCFKFESVNSKTLKNLVTQNCIFHIDDEIEDAIKIMRLKSMVKVFLLETESKTLFTKPKCEHVMLSKLNETVVTNIEDFIKKSC
jgi:hypothetical protein